MDQNWLGICEKALTLPCKAENGIYSALRILLSLLENILHNSQFLLILTSKSKQNKLIQACIRSQCRRLELIDIYISI